MNKIGNLTFLFLSTLSLRRATSIPQTASTWRLDFYPRSPCGERRLILRLHAQLQEFLSTLSLRRATPHDRGAHRQTAISIHALLAESDSKSAQNSGALLRI